MGMDLYPNRCKEVYTVNKWPYAKRCKNDKTPGHDYCEEHKR